MFTNFSSLEATRKALVVTLQRRQVHLSMTTVTVAREKSNDNTFHSAHAHRNNVPSFSAVSLRFEQNT